MRLNRFFIEVEEYVLIFFDFKEIVFDMKFFCKSCLKLRIFFVIVKGEVCWFVFISYFKKLIYFCDSVVFVNVL